MVFSTGGSTVLAADNQLAQLSTLADAICDRIVHDSYRIVIGSEDSMRKRKGISGENEALIQAPTAALSNPAAVGVNFPRRPGV